MQPTIYFAVVSLYRPSQITGKILFSGPDAIRQRSGKQFSARRARKKREGKLKMRK
jgi:hypothetical protein